MEKAAKQQAKLSSDDDEDYANAFANKHDSDDEPSNVKPQAVKQPKAEQSDGYDDEFGSEIDDHYDIY